MQRLTQPERGTGAQTTQQIGDRDPENTRMEDDAISKAGVEDPGRLFCSVDPFGDENSFKIFPKPRIRH